MIGIGIEIGVEIFWVFGIGRIGLPPKMGSSKLPQIDGDAGVKSCIRSIYLCTVTGGHEQSIKNQHAAVAGSIHSAVTGSN